MSKFSSYEYSPYETRKILRVRFTSNLITTNSHSQEINEENLVDDIIALDYLSRTDIKNNACLITSKSYYEKTKQPQHIDVSFDELISKGWVKLVWGKLKNVSNIRSQLYSVKDDKYSAIRSLLLRLDEKNYTIAADLDEGSEKTSVFSYEKLNCLSPAWVAERLWENILNQYQNNADALKKWLSLWRLLDSPQIVSSIAWRKKDAQVFIQTVLAELKQEKGFTRWDNCIDVMESEYLILKELTPYPVFYHVKTPPSTLVGKAIWSESREVEAYLFESFDTYGEMHNLMYLLLLQINNDIHCRTPHYLIKSLIDMSAESCEILFSILLQTEKLPAVLVDILLYPPSSALACLLIAKWTTHTGAWDRKLVEADLQRAREVCIDDALSILTKHVSLGSTPPSEMADLYNWLIANNSEKYIDNLKSIDLTIINFRKSLSQLDRSIIFAMFSHLLENHDIAGIHSPEFATLLDLCSIGQLEEKVDAEKIIKLYSDSLLENTASRSVHRIGNDEANALHKIAKSREDTYINFLYPFDVTTLIKKISEDDNRYYEVDKIAYSLRIHIRVLCRTLSKSDVKSKSSIVNSLIKYVKSGSLLHKEKGRIDAFSPRFERDTSSSSYISMAFDLSCALRLINAEQQISLVNAICETDEPSMLAALLPVVPFPLQSKISERINELTPEDAGEIYSLKDMQLRIDELLTAGAITAAEAYMESERNLKTLGKVRGREILRMQYDLRLMFLKKEWDGIFKYQMPPDIISHEKDEAGDVLANFRALAFLSCDTPDPIFSRSEFDRLFKKQPSIARATNWLAAELQILIKGGTFEELTGESYTAGVAAISKLEVMLAKVTEDNNSESLQCNTALLYLLLGETDKALNILSGFQFIKLQDTASAYTAVSYYRLGRLLEANAALDTAEHIFGITEVLTAARNYIAKGSVALSLPHVIINEDIIKVVSSAILKFKDMNPDNKAEVLKQKKDSFTEVLVEHIRAASASLMALVPTMKQITVDSSEDDLSALLRHCLSGRLEFLGWTVTEQSRGGYSGNLNPGERDLVINWGSTELSVVEAVICSRPLTQDSQRADLLSHFQKLLGYTQSKLMFHITYAYIEDKTGIFEFLKSCAKEHSPDGFDFMALEDISHTDSRPPGFIASYRGDFEIFQVVFLILNMGQQRQKCAAKTAAATKRRKAPRKVGTK
ncbi:hypothetical protein DCF75_07555 [Edwardsiella tarda]|uniref:hypothetical protein n=1 Tax=Edwardsiella tarda TaxID=636 RepID=UPI000E2FF512|nr:hypothetical protein [Edwardsiella tarda]UCQ55679.1 hypothetical protein DCF75_07555 [Edwardsiella tarda]